MAPCGFPWTNSTSRGVRTTASTSTSPQRAVAPSTCDLLDGPRIRRTPRSGAGILWMNPVNGSEFRERSYGRHTLCHCQHLHHTNPYPPTHIDHGVPFDRTPACASLRTAPWLQHGHWGRELGGARESWSCGADAFRTPSRPGVGRRRRGGSPCPSAASATAATNPSAGATTYAYACAVAHAYAYADATAHASS